MVRQHDDKMEDDGTMIQRCTIRDLDFVNYVIRHPTVYPTVCDDMSPPPQEFNIEPILALSEAYILTTNPHTVFVFIPTTISRIVFDVHANIIAPEGRGKAGYQSAAEALGYMFSETICRKIITFIPSLYPNTLRFAVTSGLKNEGLIEKAFLKGDDLHDVHICGITKKDWVNSREKDKEPVCL